MVGKESRQILQRCPYVDGLIIYDPKNKDSGLFGLLKISRKLRKHKFDKIIDFQNNQKSHLLSFLSFPKESYGYNNGKLGFLLTSKIRDDNKKIPAVEHQFRVLKMLGIDYPKDAHLELWPSEKDRQYVQKLMDSEWLSNNKKVVGINISASEKWRTKNWPVKYIAQLCDLLSAKNIRAVLTGEEKDRDSSRELSKLTKAKPANFVGKTDIMQLAALIDRCSVYVTPDSSPLHIAASMDTPCVALFGPTDPIRHTPPFDKLTVIKKDLPCVPCYNPQCEIVKHDCMKRISVQEVAEAIEKLMKK